MDKVGKQHPIARPNPISGYSLRHANILLTPRRREMICALDPKGPIEGAILDGFADVLGRNLLFSAEISDCARDFQDPVVGAGTEI